MSAALAATQLAPAAIDLYKRYIRIVLLLIVVILVAVIVFKIVRLAKRPSNAKYVEGAPVPIGWSPGPLTKDIFDVIDGVFVSSNKIADTYSKFNELNNNQMIDVYNEWLDRKYDQEKKYYLFPYGSLTNAVKEGPGYMSIGAGPNQKDVMLANLKRLQLE